MNPYRFGYSMFDHGFADPSLLDSLTLYPDTLINRRFMEQEEEDLLKLSNSLLKDAKRCISPPKQRHDGTSPLPLGMDWSSPPRNWDGPNTIWPHDFHTGWSYCVTIPTWSTLSESEGSEAGVFYRVQVGLQSPAGVTTTREVPRRFSDFLKLLSDLKQSLSKKKKLPPPPPKGLLRMKSRTVLEERKHSLEDWMTKLLSDIDVSRSAPVACFLELEAVARLSFRESSLGEQNVNLGHNNHSSSDLVSNHSDISVPTETLASNSGPTDETSKIGSDLHEISKSRDMLSNSDFQFSHDSVLPVDAVKQVVTSETDIADLIERFNKERAVRQYLMKKINDLETELESTKNSEKKNLEQAMHIEKERLTQLQSDMDELGRKYTEMESRLKVEQDEKAHAEALQDFDSATEQLKNSQKVHEDTELQSKSTVELLTNEVKLIQISESELRQELDRVSKNRTEFEDGKTGTECVNAANVKFLHECEILRRQLKECSLDFVIDQDNRLKMDAAAVDTLATSEHQINVLLAEAQSLTQVVTDGSSKDHMVTADYLLRKMLIDVLVDNANLRRQTNFVVRQALNMTALLPEDSQIVEDGAN